MSFCSCAYKKQPVGYVINNTMQQRGRARVICTRVASRRVLGSWQICLRFHWHLPQTTDINRRSVIYLRANNVKAMLIKGRDCKRGSDDGPFEREFRNRRRLAQWFPRANYSTRAVQLAFAKLVKEHEEEKVEDKRKKKGKRKKGERKKRKAPWPRVSLSCSMSATRGWWCHYLGIRIVFE